MSVYDVTRRDTFTNLSDVWAKEIDLYSTNQDCIKMLVGNKVDKVLAYLLEFLSCFSKSFENSTAVCHWTTGSLLVYVLHVSLFTP